MSLQLHCVCDLSWVYIKLNDTRRGVLKTATMDTTDIFLVNSTSTSPNLSTSTKAFTAIDLYTLPVVRRYLLFRTAFNPIMILLGVFGNIMTIVIIRRLKSNRSAMDRYFMSLAMTDLSVIIVGPFTVWLRSATGLRLTSSHDVVCKVFVFVNNMAMDTSAWILATMATHRALMVTWPHRVNAICTPRRSWCAVIVTVVFSSMAFSHILYGVEIVHQLGICDVKRKYEVFLEEIWVKVELFLDFLLPIVCILLSNIVLVRKLRVSVREASDQLATSETQTVSRAKTVNSVTLQAVGVSCAFIVLTSPVSIYNIMKLASEEKHMTMTDLHTFAVLKVIESSFHMLRYMNYCVNFYLYCLTGSKFRNQFKNVICFLCQKEKHCTST